MQRKARMDSWQVPGLAMKENFNAVYTVNMRKKNISSDGDSKIFQKIHITDYNLLFTNSQKNLAYIFTKNVRVQIFGVLDL